MIQTSTIDGEVSIFMPLKLKKRGGRKMILAPQGVQPASEDSSVDLTLLKALVKAHLWQRQLKSGKCSGMKELCERYDVTAKYVQLILRLNFLAPKLKEAILFGEQPRHLKLSDLMNNVPVLWSEQQEVFGLKVLDSLV
jgi:hypothetical protein